MPLYEYVCEVHGRFEATRPIAEFDQPCACPACGALSPRATSIPRLAALSHTARQAHATNERARHEPKSSRDLAPGEAGRKRTRARQYANGAKNMPSDRPWMLSP
ncbi:MAG: zinc ribbon domain-containing protein [Pseudomonadota bacterium]